LQAISTMFDHATPRHPTEVKLHAKSGIPAITFDDGGLFDLPCEYLRVFSRAAEGCTLEHPPTGKEDVNISSIEPQGQYAVRIVFDDGHDTGIHSWNTFYRLGADYAHNWADYLVRLERLGYQRTESGAGERRLRMLYFAWPAKKLRRESETLTAPASVNDVQSLLRWLGTRKRGAAVLFEPERVQVMVNRQFTEPFTRLHDGDETGSCPPHRLLPPPLSWFESNSVLPPGASSGGTEVAATDC
jgi:DUF971 family protein/molybdopterin converting factor small subunit